MSIMYSMIAFIASAVKGSSNVSYGHRSGSSVDRAFGTANAFGTIMFAFGGQIIMPEIQVATRSAKHHARAYQKACRGSTLFSSSFRL